MIRKESSEGIGYSVVELDTTRHILAAAAPREGNTLREQAHDALKTIRALMDEESTRGSIVRQAVFMRDIDQIEACRQLIHEFYGDDLPATSYIPQPPCEGKLIEIEALGVGGNGGTDIRRHCERMVVSQHEGIAWAHLANVCPKADGMSVYDQSVYIFENAAARLSEKGFSFDQVIRTWIYIGDIVGPEGETQRYKELNRARTDLYEEIKFKASSALSGATRAVYPASTGIGTEGKNVALSCMALSSQRDDISWVPLENPLQTSAFDYGTKYGRKSPKFARAMTIACGDMATILVSGTASIIDAETKFVGDVEGQTRQTLDNIAALIDEENHARHGLPGLGATLADVGLVRVYVKCQEDYAKTKAVCESMLGEVPTIYVVADVCRDDLLVEIEAMAFTQRSS